MDIDSHHQIPSNDSLHDDQGVTTQDTLVGVALGVISDGRFKAGELLRHENHADVYFVTAIFLDEQENTYEARVYDLQVDSRKLRQYRLRNLKRLSSRKVLEEKWRGSHVVVYTTDSKFELNPKTPGQKNEEEAEVRDVCQPVVEETMGKSSKPAGHPKPDHKREITRLKQLEKRRFDRMKDYFELPFSMSMGTRGTNTMRMP